VIPQPGLCGDNLLNLLEISFKESLQPIAWMVTSQPLSHG